MLGADGKKNSLIRILGTNFGAYTFSQAQNVRVGLTTCAATVWTSDSTLSCSLAAGVAAFLSVEVTAGLQYNGSDYLAPRRASLAARFSYNSAVISHVRRANGAPTGGKLRIYC